MVNGLAQNVPVADQSLGNGDIVVQSDKGIVKASTPYAPALLGVVVDQPLMEVNDRTAVTRPIASSGRVIVKVTRKNGDIAIGDFITSSDIAGVGGKATGPGIVLGTALEAFPLAGQAQTGDESTILVDLSIREQTGSTTQQGGGFNRFFTNFTSAVKTDNRFAKLTRYIIAALVGTLFVFFSLIYFGINVRNALQAIGRNPIAKGPIQQNLIISLILGVIVIVAGVAIAALIILL